MASLVLGAAGALAGTALTPGGWAFLGVKGAGWGFFAGPAVGGLYFPPGDTAHAQPNELTENEEASHVVV